MNFQTPRGVTLLTPVRGVGAGPQPQPQAPALRAEVQQGPLLRAPTGGQAAAAQWHRAPPSTRLPHCRPQEVRDGCSHFTKAKPRSPSPHSANTGRGEGGERAAHRGRLRGPQGEASRRLRAEPHQAFGSPVGPEEAERVRQEPLT